MNLLICLIFFFCRKFFNCLHFAQQKISSSKFFHLSCLVWGKIRKNQEKYSISSPWNFHFWWLLFQRFLMLQILNSKFSAIDDKYLEKIEQNTEIWLNSYFIALMVNLKYLIIETEMKNQHFSRLLIFIFYIIKKNFFFQILLLNIM